MIPVAITFPVSPDDALVDVAELALGAVAADELWADVFVMDVFWFELTPNPMATKTMRTPTPKHGSLTQLPTFGISVVEILKPPPTRPTRIRITPTTPSATTNGVMSPSPIRAPVHTY
jgi:hypothetical protein